MSKEFLRDGKMDSEAVFVSEASQLARQLTRSEARGPGDMENAWRRLEARYGVPWRAFWALRYRTPNAVTAGILNGLRSAWAAERERQIRRLTHELECTRAATGHDHLAVVAAEAVVGKTGR